MKEILISVKGGHIFEGEKGIWEGLYGGKGMNKGCIFYYNIKNKKEIIVKISQNQETVNKLVLQNNGLIY